MEVKLFELRDKGTFMPVMATLLFLKPATQDDPVTHPRERFLLERAGYGIHQLTIAGIGNPYIILTKLDGVEAEYDPFKWGMHRRTLFHAHQHMIEHWSELKSGDLIDVEYILGETTTPKQTEQGQWR